MINVDKLLFNLDNVEKGLPITADVFLTNFCNNKCGYCAYGRWEELKQTPRQMAYNRFIEYLARMRSLGIKGIILTGGGEPTVAKDFDAITNYLENEHFPYGINTNFNVYKYINPVFLKVSVDAWSRASYIAKRGVDGFDKVVNNISRYREEQRKHNGSAKLGVQCLGTTLDEVQRFYDFWHKQDLDYMVVRPMESTRGTYYQNSSENRKERKRILEFLRDMAEDDMRLVINYKWYKTQTAFFDCPANDMQLNIDEQGNVCYCCHKPYEIVGHILDEDILEKKRKFKTDFSRCDIPCRLTAPNEIMEKMEQKPNDWMFI